MHNFNIWMIVYVKNEKRMNNFLELSTRLNCRLFEAIDTINEHEKYAKFALENVYTDKVFIDKYKIDIGKLGCNLSHQLLLQKINSESQNSDSSDWNLILEDDVSIDTNDFYLKMSNIIEKANQNNSDYIHLITHNKFMVDQLKQKKVNDLYEMIPQYYCTAFLVNQKGIQTMLNCFPICREIDIEFSRQIKNMNSLCWINNTFKNEGSIDRNNTNNTKYGSLLWKGHNN